MGQFGIDTRRWLESAIKQRKLLLRVNKSHKLQAHVETALHTLLGQLECYTYARDEYMARFITQNIDRILTILPGKGSTCHQKRMNELADIYKKANRILAEEPMQMIKTCQYEMEFY